jgi:hypothetical protein
VLEEEDIGVAIGGGTKAGGGSTVGGGGSTVEGAPVDTASATLMRGLVVAGPSLPIVA